MDIQKDNRMYMQIALLTSQRSYARRLKVGCVIVKNHSIISFGWNGMPTGYDNCCEMEVDGRLVTRPEVQHAELNAIAKLAENGYSSKGAAIFITHSPCIHCALLIQKCGITDVYYHTLYRSNEGLEFLKRAGVNVTHLDVEPPSRCSRATAGSRATIAAARVPCTRIPHPTRSGRITSPLFPPSA